MKPSLIVHPISFSPSGKAALATAVALARFHGADLHVLEVRRRRWSSHDPVVRSIGDPEVEPHFAEFVRSVDCADVKVSAVELEGDIVDAVVDYANSTAADLVVVADQARQHGPYSRAGMYANDITRRLSYPVLSVPAFRTADAGAGVPFTKILSAIEPSPASSEVIGHALALVGQIGAEVSYVALDETPTANAVPRGTPSEMIVRTAAEIGANLVVIAGPARKNVFMQSPLAQVLRHSPCPTLVVPTMFDRNRVPATAAEHAFSR